MAKKSEFLTVEDVMELFSISRRTVYRWIESGKLEGKRAGKRWLFERGKVMGLLK